MSAPPAAAATRPDRPWHAMDPDAVATALGVEPTHGLDPSDAAARLDRYGRNVPPEPVRPSAARAVLGQLVAPVPIALGVALVVSLVIREISAALLLAAAVVIDVVVGANETLKARAPVTAIGSLWATTAMVRRAGRVIPVNATELVPGDVVAVGPGDVVPADGRLVDCDALLVDEAIVTGEAAPSAKAVPEVEAPDAALPERTDLVHAGSRVLQGRATFVVTATGQASELGRIAGLLGATDRDPTPLRRRLRASGTAPAVLAVGAIAVSVAVGWYRGESVDRLVLVAIAVAVAAIPVGLPTFVRATLAVGVQRLGMAGTPVRYLDAVAALGHVGAVDAELVGVLTLGRPTARSVFYRGSWYTVEGDGAATTGRMLHVAGATLPGFDQLAYISALATDVALEDEDAATAGSLEMALVVLAAKLGVDADRSRHAYPRRLGLPFDATTGLAASVHRLPLDGPDSSVVTVLVIGTPEALLGRSTSADWSGDEPLAVAAVRPEVEAALARMRSEGMRVVAVGARRLTTAHEDAAGEAAADPTALLVDLTFVGLVGIVDPIRPDTRAALAEASRAGIDIRAVTGGDAVRAASIAAELGLAGEAIGGPELASLSDETVRSRLTGLRVLGWASAIDRLRLTRALQAGGTGVAVLSNGVVDAPAMRAAGVGAASRPGSVVTDQAASVVVSDGGLAALLRAIAIGRETRDRVAAYGRLAAIQLVGLVSLFVTAAVLDVNDGLPLVPVQVLFLGLVVTVFPVVAIASDVADPGVMEHPPDDPGAGLVDRPTILRRLAAGLALGLAALAAYPVSAAIGWGEPAFDRASVPMTLAFVALGFGTLLIGLAARRPVDWAFKSPLPRFLGVLLVPLVLLFLSTELGVLKAFLVTVDLRQEQWGIALLLGSAAFWVVEADKLLQRRLRIRFH